MFLFKQKEHCTYFIELFISIIVLFIIVANQCILYIFQVNAAICDEVVRLEDKVNHVKEERK